MSDSDRILPPFVNMPTHNQGVKPAMVCTDLAVSTVSLGKGHYVAVVANQSDAPVAMLMLLFREDIKAHIALLHIALTDCDSLHMGKQPLGAHAVSTMQ